MKVRVNAVYTFRPVLLDCVHVVSQAVPGQRVRVVNLRSAPKANTMGQCHIEDASTGDFLGMVSTNSLVRE